MFKHRFIRRRTLLSFPASQIPVAVGANGNNGNNGNNSATFGTAVALIIFHIRYILTAALYAPHPLQDPLSVPSGTQAAGPADGPKTSPGLNGSQVPGRITAIEIGCQKRSKLSEIHHMNASRIFRLTTAFALLLSNGTGVLAQDNAAGQDAQELKQIQEDLKKEIAGLRTEMKAMKNEFRAMRAELTKAVAAIKSAKPAARPKPQRPAMTMLGKKGPEYTVTTVDGLQTQVAGKRDKPQVLFCYASWCGFCKRSLPWMESLSQEYKDKGVEVLAINLDARGQGGRTRTEEQSLKHYRDMKLTMPMTMTTTDNDTKKIGTAYKAQSFPTLFVLGTTGEVEAVHVGAKQGLAEAVGKQLDVLLAGKTRKDFAK